MDPIVSRVATRFAARLVLGPGRLDDKATASLRKMKKFPVRHTGKDFNAAVISAAGSAKKLGQTVYVYQGNSFMHAVWRTAVKLSDVLSPINNNGDKVCSVTPDLELSFHDVKRDDAL